MGATADRYRRLSADFAMTVSTASDDQWADPSPCAGWDARDVAEHVISTQGMFLGFVGRDMPATAASATLAARWDTARAAVQAELDDPVRASTTFQGFDGETTFEAAVDRFLCTDLVLHRWDLTTAIGRTVEIDPGDMAHVRAAMALLVDKMRGPKAFGPELEAPAGCNEQTAFLAFFGRRA